MDHFLNVSVWLVIELAVIWFIVYLFFGDKFVSSPLVEETLEKQRSREALEEEQLRKDLEATKPNQRNSLLQLGIAENRTNVRDDEEYALLADHWLCDGRWLGTSILQFLLSLVISWPLSYIPFFNLGYLTVVALIASTMVLALTCYVIVKEKHHLGVKRFGKQCQGFLGEGLQFVFFPWLGELAEEPELVPLMNMVWGSKVFGRQSEYRLDTTFGANNPSPGKIRVILNGRWPTDVELVITLRVRRRFKTAWHAWLNDYRSMEDIVRQIVTVSSAVLTTLARKNNTKLTAALHLSDEDNDIRSLLDFVNKVPEIAGSILLSLQKMGHERLAGIIIVGVTISSITVSEEFQDMFRSLDEKSVGRKKEAHVGRGIANRLECIREFVKQMNGGTDNPQEVMQLEELFTQREITKGGNGLDNLIKALVLKKLQELNKD